MQSILTADSVVPAGAYKVEFRCFSYTMSQYWR